MPANNPVALTPETPLGNSNRIIVPVATSASNRVLDQRATGSAPVNVVMTVTVSPSEINPSYTVKKKPLKASSAIIITTRNDDDQTPFKNVTIPNVNWETRQAQRALVIKVETCTEAGRADTDGHVHDSSRRADPNGCVRSKRPRASLTWGKGKNKVIGNPITIRTDDAGNAEIEYTPPTGSGIYISGRDIIIATLSKAANPALNLASDIKDNSKTITTKVPGLQQMPGSANCTGGVNYIFARQDNHACLFYGTQATNDAVVRIANAFALKQTECRDSQNHQCTIVDDSGKTKIVTIQGEPIPIMITAMGLPWGGLSDYPGNWVAPHKSHNTGKQVDIGWSNLDMDRIWLLRYVITLDTNYESFVSDEGGNIAATKKSKQPHFHIYFKE
jgi:hypothetical protein